MSGDDRAPAEPESVSSGDDDHILQHSAEESSAEEHFDDVDIQDDVGSETSGELNVSNVLCIQLEPEPERPSSCCRSRSDKDCFHHLTAALHLSLCCESDVHDSIFMSLIFRFLLMVSLNRRRGRPLFL